MGLPFDKDVVGDDLGLAPAPPNACRVCSGPHFAVNCPTQYYLTCREHCPGFNNKGERIPSAWNGTKLSAAARSDWTTYIVRHGLIRSRFATADVKF